MLCYQRVFLVVHIESAALPQQNPDCCPDKPTQLDTVTKSELAPSLTDDSHRSSGHRPPATGDLP